MEGELKPEELQKQAVNIEKIHEVVIAVQELFITKKVTFNQALHVFSTITAMTIHHMTASEKDQDENLKDFKQSLETHLLLCRLAEKVSNQEIGHA